MPDKIACIRAGVVAGLGALTALLAIYRVFTLHTNRRLSPLMLLLYYLIVIHCAAGSLEWIFGWSTPVTLFISYAKAVELLIVCYFYLDIATKMMHWNGSAGRSILLGALLLLFSYFTAFAVLGFLLSIEPWNDCHAPYWIWFSLGQLFTVQLMVSSFLMIIHKINSISATPSIRQAQRTQLLIMLYAYETSAFTDSAWHVVLYMLSDELGGCSGIFKHNQMMYSAAKLPYDIMSFLLPVWTILYVFRPSARSAQLGERRNVGDDDTLSSSASSTSSNSTSVLIVRNWQRRYRPLNVSRYEAGIGRMEDRRFVDPTRQVRRNRQTASASTSSGGRGDRRKELIQPGVRRVSSAPSLVPPRRRHSVSHSIISSPLYPIPEEDYRVRRRLLREDYYDDEGYEGYEGMDEDEMLEDEGAMRVGEEEEEEEEEHQPSSLDRASMDGMVDEEP